MDAERRFEEMKRRAFSHPTLMDDVPFTVAVRRSMALAQLIIRTTLSQEDLVVTDVRCQEKVPGIGHKGVVFDALCFDGCGNMYDVEVQKGHFEDLPKRAAFYEAMLTVHSVLGPEAGTTAGCRSGSSSSSATEMWRREARRCTTTAAGALME